MAVVLIQVLTISFRTVSSCLVWKISMRIKSRNLSRRIFSRPRAVRSRKFQNISLVANRTCANFIETRRVYCFSTDSTVLGLKCFASEAYHSRSVICGWQVLTEIEKLSRRMFSWMHIHHGLWEVANFKKNHSLPEPNLRTWSRPGEFTISPLIPPL